MMLLLLLQEVITFTQCYHVSQVTQSTSSRMLSELRFSALQLRCRQPETTMYLEILSLTYLFTPQLLRV